MKTVLLLGTLDTKGEEYAYVRELLRERGVKTLMMDLGVLGEPAFAPDVTATDVAHAAHTSLDVLRARQDRGSAVTAMQNGARTLVRKLYADGAFHGVLGL